MIATSDVAWHTALHRLLSCEVLPSRAGKCRETCAWNLVTSAAQSFILNKRRKLSPVYASAELLWILSGDDSTEMIREYAPQYEQFAESNGRVHGAYGPRVATQLEPLRVLLRKDHSTRRAVISLWDHADLDVADRVQDVPCTVAWHFLVRQGGLHMFCMMRSNDVWLGFPYDSYVNSCILWLLADSLGLSIGAYTHFTSSMHLYEKNVKAAQDAVDSAASVVGLVRGDTTHENWRGSGLPLMTAVRQAVDLERDVRTKRVLNMGALGELPGPLHDAVALCSTKWMPELKYEQGLHSHRLQAAWEVAQCS